MHQFKTYSNVDELARLHREGYVSHKISLGQARMALATPGSWLILAQDSDTLEVEGAYVDVPVGESRRERRIVTLGSLVPIIPGEVIHTHLEQTKALQAEVHLPCHIVLAGEIPTAVVYRHFRQKVGTLETITIDSVSALEHLLTLLKDDPERRGVEIQIAGDVVHSLASTLKEKVRELITLGFISRKFIYTLTTERD